MFSLTNLVCKIFLIPEGVTGDSDVLLILCVSVGTIWLGGKVWGGLFGGGKDQKVSWVELSVPLLVVAAGDDGVLDGNQCC